MLRYATLRYVLYIYIYIYVYIYIYIYIYVYQIVGYLNDFHPFADVQSAYRRGHSTETAVLKVFSDIIDGIADGKIMVLSLLDLTAAFDTVDHDILLKRLENTYGLSGTIFDWLRTYVEGRRTQAVHILWRHVVHSLCNMRRTSGVGTGTSVVYALHSGYRGNHTLI